MIGLSITAIGLRSIKQCFSIFQQLRIPLQLDFLELAIGSHCYVGASYPDVPLVIHDSCLHTDTGRKRLDLLCPKTWKVYEQFIANHDVRAMSLHPPLQRRCTRQALETALKNLELVLKVPVYVEVMPSPEYWCSSWETLIDHLLLLDVSHVLIWHQGDSYKTQKGCQKILENFAVGAIHLSHNGGYSDDHELIPSNVWFREAIPIWQQQYWVTFESLPVEYAAYERLDKKVKRCAKEISSLR